MLYYIDHCIYKDISVMESMWLLVHWQLTWKKFPCMQTKQFAWATLQKFKKEMHQHTSLIA